MKRLSLCALTLLSLSSLAIAQDRDKPTPATMRRDTVATASPTVQQTESMWFYEQERSRYEDPKVAVRRKAELRGSQRTDRIAAMKWYGMSNSRPTCNTTPYFSTYSPTWVSNSFDPNRWRNSRDVSSPTIIVR